MRRVLYPKGNKSQRHLTVAFYMEIRHTMELLEKFDLNV